MSSPDDRERQAARAFRRNAPLEKVAERLGVSLADADAWLDSPACVAACQALPANVPARPRGD